jgi:hypothetical protein
MQQLFLLNIIVNAAFGYSLSPLSPRWPSTTSDASLSSPSVDTFQYLDNGVIRLGIDLSRGGSIGWLGPSSNQSLSLLNIHDFGREVQGSF